MSKPILTLKHAGYVITKAQEAMAARDKFLFGEDDRADGSFQTQALVVAEYLKDADDSTPIPVLQITWEEGRVPVFIPLNVLDLHSPHFPCPPLTPYAHEHPSSGLRTKANEYSFGLT